MYHEEETLNIKILFTACMLPKSPHCTISNIVRFRLALVVCSSFVLYGSKLLFAHGLCFVVQQYIRSLLSLQQWSNRV